MDDDTRYQEALQRSLLPKGWDQAFDEARLRAWVSSNRELLRTQARATIENSTPSLEEHFARVVENFEPKTKFDLPSTAAIFGPILEKVESGAEAIGLRLIRDVELVTSTSISPSPFARPTTGTHQLFVGPGTSAFCNYWSKIYTAIVMTVASDEACRVPVKSPEDLLHRIEHNLEGVVMAARLALYFAVYDTVLGFGSYQQPPNYLSYRLELLQAMEVFALSHEYAHFVAEERELKFSSDHELELFCDELGLQISRAWGGKSENWLAFAGVGALAFFQAIDTSTTCAEILAASRLSSGGTSRCHDSSHPSPVSRIANTVLNVIKKTDHDQKECAERFIKEYELICRAIHDFVTRVLADTTGKG